MRTLNRIIDLFNVGLRWFVLTLATAIFAIVILTVITRYTFSFVFSWSEEVPRYLLIWVSFLTAALGVDVKDHIAFDYLYNRLGGRSAKLVELGVNIGLMAFGAVMLIFGWRFVADFGGDWMESLPLTNIWYYPALPIAGLLIIVYAARDQLNVWFAPELRTRRHEIA